MKLSEKKKKASLSWCDSILEVCLLVIFDVPANSPAWIVSFPGGAAGVLVVADMFSRGKEEDGDIKVVFCCSVEMARNKITAITAVGI